MEQDDGNLIPIPSAGVARVELGATTDPDRVQEAEEPADRAPEKLTDPHTGLTYDRKPLELVKGAVPAAAFTLAPAMQLEGLPVETPRTRDQLAAFGGAAWSRRPGIEPGETIDGDWDFSDPFGNNDWAPSRWSVPSIDPTFAPSEDWDADPLEGNNWSPAQWTEGAVTFDWSPLGKLERRFEQRRLAVGAVGVQRSEP